jgi:hypothetical protein
MMMIIIDQWTMALAAPRRASINDKRVAYNRLPDTL